MVKPMERRVKHYEEAVIYDRDRPKWAPEKAKDMFEVWKDEIAPYQALEVQVQTILEEAGVPTTLRPPYYSFARKIYKKITKKRATRRQLEAELRYWVDHHGLDRAVLNRILGFLLRATGGARARR